MPQDAFTIKYIATELNTALLGAKVNKINQPDPEEVVLHLYTKNGVKRLLISANAMGARVSFTEDEKPNPLTAYGFCMLLRKYLQSAEVTSVTQVGFERIVKIEFSALNDFFESRERALYIEVMGKYSNVVLTESDKILGSLKAFNLDINSLRPLVSGMIYALPVKQDKFLPDDVNLSAFLDDIFSKTPIDGVNLAQILFDNVVGLSKPTASEIARKYHDNFNGFLRGVDVVKTLNDFLTNPKISPCIKVKDGVIKDFFVTDYKIDKFDTIYFDSILEAQTACYKQKEAIRQTGDFKRKLLSIVKKQADKLAKREEIILKKQEDAKDLEDNRLKGELLIANLYRLKDGNSFTEVKDYYNDYKLIKIPLDKDKSIKQNAENYFKRYNKQKRTLSAVLPQIEELEREKAYVKSLFAELEIAETLSDFIEIENELKSIGFIRATKAKKKVNAKPKFLTYNIDGYTVRVGRSNINNDELLSVSNGGALWLYAKSYHSSHVVIEYKGEEFPESVIKASAEICAFYSEARDGGKVEVDYTKRKFVKKPPKSNPGFVIYTNQLSIVVNPLKHEEYLLKRG